MISNTCTDACSITFAAKLHFQWKNTKNQHIQQRNPILIKQIKHVKHIKQIKLQDKNNDAEEFNFSVNF